MDSLGLVVFNELLSVCQDELEHLFRNGEKQSHSPAVSEEALIRCLSLYKSPVYSRDWLKINRNWIKRRKKERKKKDGEGEDNKTL